MTWGYIVVSIGLVGLLIEMWLDYVKQADALGLEIQRARHAVEQHTRAGEEAQGETEAAKKRVDEHKDYRSQLLYEIGDANERSKELERRHEKRLKRLERQQRLQKEL